MKTIVQRSWLPVRAGLSVVRRFGGRARVSSAARLVGGGVLDLIFPPSCVSCAAELEDRVARQTDVALCDECIEKIELFYEPMCPRCGAPVPSVGARKPEGCYRCRGR